MKIKNILYKVFIAALPLGGVGEGSLLCSCSNIAEDERLIYVEPQAVNAPVLIEDFTGQKCVNCPNATEAIHQIQSVYGDDAVIAVAIHCGPFGVSTAKKGLMTDLGQTYWNTWFDDTQGQPVAKINRGEASNDYANWASEVAGQLSKTTNVKISLSGNYNSESRYFEVFASITGHSGDTGKLQFWLVEDSIVASQSQPDGSVKKDYVHNHVLRESLNGDWGEDVTFIDGTLTMGTYTTISDSYNADNCSVVAFIYDDKNGVRQVVKKKITEL